MNLSTKRALVAGASAVLLPFLLGGCGTPQANYVETGGRNNIVTIGEVNIQDFIQVAETMVGSLLASGVLDRVEKPPAQIAITLVQNRTGQQFDTDLLTTKIRIAVNKSQKAVGQLNHAQDRSDPGSTQAEKDFREGVKLSRLPDFTLSGKIIETKARAGNLRQSTFSFQLALACGDTAVWEEEKEITKQGKRPAAGF